VLRASDLPFSVDGWADIMTAAMGSPDPVHGRQLDGMGGGISSTSKICVLAPSERDNADVDFTFVQVGIRDGSLDLAGNCGNMSAVVGPVAWDWGFVPEGEMAGRIRTEGREAGEGYHEALVRVFNTNTSKIIHARFRVMPHGGQPPPYRYCPAGSYTMDGVPGAQSRITLSFVDPAGAKTGRALPTGNAVDILELPDGSSVRASLVDVSNPGVFVALADIGLGEATPDLFTPATVEADPELKDRLEMIRRAGAVRMGLDPNVQSVPKIVLLFPRSESMGDGVDVRCLAMSMGQAHKAVPLTLSLCLGAAANMEGTVAAHVRRRRRKDSDEETSPSVVIGHPGGTVEISATFRDGVIVSADLHRTARLLMEGEVYY
jgi:2-methylaconitate cis-trans-isomerase PrpF